MPKRMKRIAVIGGGPKAVAIAAKAAVLRDTLEQKVSVTIFERYEIGAHWTGRHGYTTGQPALCTPAERDLGFPYHSSLGKRVDQALFAYSWSAFAVSQSRNYGAWVDSGRTPPSHQMFAEYLAWATKASRMPVALLDVKRLQPVGDKWRVHGLSLAGKATTYRALFDGVVVTGPGPSKAIAGLARPHARVFDGTDFWHRLDEVRELLEAIRQTRECAIKNEDTDELDKLAIVVVGGGGTGAALLAWLAEHATADTRLYLVANQATIHARADNPFENRVFSDEGTWGKISKENRAKFYERLTRGIVWDSVINQIKSANIEPIDGKATRLEDRGDHVRVYYTRDNVELSTDGAIVIDATGFDPWWFTELLHYADGFRWSTTRKETLKASIGPLLDFGPRRWTHPVLQAPNLASDVGPGFGSLMTLGILSDSVLSRYLDPEGIGS